MNKVILMGNLGAEPEMRYTQGGTAVLNMRLATSEKYKDAQGELKERTDWHNVVVWGKRGEGLAKVLKKGSKILVEGSIRTSSYEDREGVRRSKTDVHALGVELCDKAPGASTQAREPKPRASASVPVDQAYNETFEPSDAADPPGDGIQHSGEDVPF